MQSMTCAIEHDANTGELETMDKSSVDESMLSNHGSSRTPSISESDLDIGPQLSSTMKLPPIQALDKLESLSPSSCLLTKVDKSNQIPNVQTHIVAAFRNIMLDEDTKTETDVRSEITSLPDMHKAVDVQKEHGLPFTIEERSVEGVLRAKQLYNVKTVIKSEPALAQGYRPEFSMADTSAGDKVKVESSSNIIELKQQRQLEEQKKPMAVKLVSKEMAGDELDWQYNVLPQKPKKKITVNMTDFASVKRSGMHTETEASSERPVFKTVLAIGNVPNKTEALPPLTCEEPYNNKTDTTNQFPSGNENCSISVNSTSGDQFDHSNDSSKNVLKIFPQYSDADVSLSVKSKEDANKTAQNKLNKVSGYPSASVKSKNQSSIQVHSGLISQSQNTRPKVNIPPAKQTDYKPQWVITKKTAVPNSTSKPEPAGTSENFKIAPKTVTNVKVFEDKRPAIEDSYRHTSTEFQSSRHPSSSVDSIDVTYMQHGNNDGIGTNTATLQGSQQELEQQYAQLQQQFGVWQQQILVNQQLLQQNQTIPDDKLLLLNELQKQMALNQQLLQQNFLVNQSKPYSTNTEPSMSVYTPTMSSQQMYSVRPDVFKVNRNQSQQASNAPNRVNSSLFTPKPFSSPPQQEWKHEFSADRPKSINVQPSTFLYKAHPETSYVYPKREDATVTCSPTGQQINMKRSHSLPAASPSHDYKSYLKPVGDRRTKESDPRFAPKVAPREELMIAIRNLGGASALKQVINLLLILCSHKH